MGFLCCLTGCLKCFAGVFSVIGTLLKMFEPLLRMNFSDLTLLLCALVALTLVVFYIFIKATTKTYPEIIIHPSEKSFVSFDSEGKG